MTVVADPDDPFNETLHAAVWGGSYRVPEIHLAVSGYPKLPLLLMPEGAAAETGRLGSGTEIYELSPKTDRRAVTRVRITRDVDRVRYRWGEWPKLDLGDQTVEGRHVSTGKGPELLPDHAKRLEARLEMNDWTGALVFLECSETVRMVDALRLVECAAADPAVLIHPLPFPFMPRDPSSIEPPPGGASLSSDLPWPEVRGALSRTTGREVVLFFAPEAPGLPYDRWVVMPPEALELELPADATCGDVWSKVLTLVPSREK